VMVASPVSKAPGSASGAGVSFRRPHVACVGRDTHTRPRLCRLPWVFFASWASNDFLAHDLPIIQGSRRDGRHPHHMWLTLSAIIVPIGAMVLWFVRLRRRASRSRTASPPLRGLGELIRREEELKERR